MKFYKTYQECKIANPNSEVIQRNGDAMFLPVDNSELITMLSGGIHCKPSEYLISVKDFFDKGHVFLVGDYFLNQHGQVIEVGKRYEDGIVIMPDEANYRIPGSDEHCYILRASAMEIPTQSPEEREALDMIDTTSKQVEGLANDSEFPNGSEWDGEGLPPVGVECCFTPDNNLWGFASTDTYLGEVLKYEGEQFVFLLSHDKYNMRPCHLIVSRTDKGEFSKPESPKQKAGRERLEAAYDLYLKVQERDEGPGFAASFKQFQDGMMSTCRKDYLSIIDITGYRKESK